MASIGAAGFLLALGACSAPPPPHLSCAAPPDPLALQKAATNGYKDGYHAGELAQALRDQARARLAAASLFKSKGDPLLLATTMTLLPPSPTVPLPATTIPAGTAVPLDKEWLRF